MTTARRPWWRADDTSFVNPRSALALVGVSLTWVFSLTGLPQQAPIGLPASVEAWARACPTCGTVESVAKLLTPQASSELSSELATYFYRLTIRMADGSIRRIEQPAPITPGSQVLVQDGAVRPVAPALPAVAPAPARRQ